MPTLFDHSAGQRMFVAGRNGFLSEQVHFGTDCVSFTLFLIMNQGHPRRIPRFAWSKTTYQKSCIFLNSQVYYTVKPVLSCFQTLAILLNNFIILNPLDIAPVDTSEL